VPSWSEFKTVCNAIGTEAMTLYISQVVPHLHRRHTGDSDFESILIAISLMTHSHSDGFRHRRTLIVRMEELDSGVCCANSVFPAGRGS
jgi:hypothetical protein